ncbi:MAG: hypothetical protein LH480_04455 [Rubrivivax sp.]|nr:hypothetical protein [Rubrivivax sp.]
MTQFIRIRQGAALAGAALLAAAALSGCGGGGGVDAAALDGNAVPASAGASAQAFITFQQGLDASDTGESLSLGEFLPPKDDTAEPTPVG